MRRPTAAVLFVLVAALLAGCGDDTSSGSCRVTTDCPAGQVCFEGRCIGGGDADAEVGADADADVEPPDGLDGDGGDGSCPTRTCGGACCAEGELCTPTGGCCVPERVCGSGCCAAGSECVRGTCLPACAAGVRCGADFAECCATGQVCAGSCVTPGDPCDFSFECPEGWRCEATLGRCLPEAAVTCEYHPPVGTFDPELEWLWEGSTTAPESDQSVVTPLVVQLTDDDGDGAIDRHDVPDVVFSTYPSGGNGAGRLRAVSGDDGRELWTAAETICGYSGLAAGDLDGDGTVEILTGREGATGGCRHDGSLQQLLAFSHEGTLEWGSHDSGGAAALFDFDLGGTPSIADLDGDGRAEVVLGASVTEADGLVRWVGNLNLATNYSDGTTMVAVADVDGDGAPEIVGGNAVYEADGTVLWSDAARRDGFPAVASILEAGRAEIVVVSYVTVRIVAGVDGTLLWGPVDIPGGGNGGPPTVADFDGDGSPEIGVAGLTFYTVFDPAEADGVLWSAPTYENAASITGSSVFDFENDGHAEVVYADECFLRVYDGTTGTVLFQRSSTSGTHSENPVIADLDNDRHAEIVLVSSRYVDPRGSCESLYPTEFTGYTNGLRVWGDRLDNWVPTRRIWNQHAYHITNVTEDGGIPAHERDSWRSFNSYRQNAQDGASHAPDLLPLDLRVAFAACPAALLLQAQATNGGSAGIPAGLPVSFYRGTPAAPEEWLGTVLTTVPLLPGASTWVEQRFDVPAGELGPWDFFVRVDDVGDGSGVHHECAEDNNVAELADVSCELLL